MGIALADLPIEHSGDGSLGKRTRKTYLLTASIQVEADANGRNAFAVFVDLRFLTFMLDQLSFQLVEIDVFGVCKDPQTDIDIPT